MPDIIVRNQSELDAAIKAAKGGETIKLAAGTYTSVSVIGKTFTSPVTIQSLDANNRANVTALQVNSSNNVVFKNLIAAQDFKPAEDWMTANRIYKSNNITLDNVTISGGTGDVTKSKGIGLYIRDGINVNVVNSSMDHFAFGMSVQNVNGMLVQGNNFHDNRGDHTNFSEMNNVTIDNNMFSNLFPVGAEHPDAIQFMTKGRAFGSSNVTISNNVVMQGSGLGTQGFFLGNEDGLPYTNVTIKNNLIYLNGWYHGINVVTGNNINIESNTIISKMDAAPLWIRLENVNGGKVVNNVTDAITITDTSKNIANSGNAVLSADAVTLRKIVDINSESKALLANLIVKGIGYQPPAGSAAAAIIAKELATATKPANANLLMDLQFTNTGTGIVDQTRWSSDETVKAIDLANISNGMYKVRTGAGFELSRPQTLQIFSLSAFTLSFDMKRDSTSAGAGQILGIYQSWAISLRADGELMFNLTNATGKSFSLVTNGAKLTDTATHKVALTYDSAKGKAIVYVDGVAKGAATMSGSTRPMEFWGLYVGSPWGTAFSGGVGDIELRDGAMSSAEVQTLKTATTTTAQAAAVLQSTLAKALVSNVTSVLASNSADSTNATIGAATLAGTTGAMAAAQLTVARGAIGGAGDVALGNVVLRSPLLSGKLASMDFYHV